MFGNLGSGELIIVGVILLLFLGNRKMKVVARSLGKSTKEMKKLKNEVEKTIQGVTNDLEEVEERETESKD